MNVPKLLRTALFSVLALVVAAGMAAAPAQAQDDIFVDDSGNDSQAGGPNSPVRTLQEAINTRVDEDGDRVVVRGGDYTVNSAALNVNYGIEIEFTEAGDGATVADFNGSINFAPAANGSDSEVDINSTNGGSLEFTTATTFELRSGDVNIDASSTVVLASGATVNRGTGSGAPALNNSGPTFGDNVNVEYDVGESVTSGPELPSDGDLGDGNLDVVGSSSVTFDQNVDASEFGLANGATANFQSNDLTAGAASGAGAASASGNDILVDGNASLTVGGTLEIEGTDVGLTVDGDFNQNQNVSTGDVTFDEVSTSVPSPLLDGSGTVDINTATFDLTLNDDGTDETVNTSIQATANSSDFTIGTVTTNSASDSDETDDLLVDLDAGGSEASFTVTSGSDFGAITIDNSNARLDIDGGITSTGAVDNDGTTDIEGAATLASGGGLINNSGTVDVKAAATLGGGSSIINTGTVNITASGATLDASGSSIDNGSGTIDADVDATLIGAVNNETGGSDGQVDVAGGGTVTINTGSGSVTHTGSESNANGFTGDGTVEFATENGNVHTIAGGNFTVSEVDATADVTVSSNTDVSGVFDADAEITVNADLRIDGNARFGDGSISTTGGSPSLTFGGTNSATLFPGDTFDFDGDVTFAKTSATSSPIVTLNNSVRIQGDVTVQHNDLTGSEDVALDLQSNDLFVDGSSSTFTLNGSGTEREIAGTGRVVFENGGSVTGAVGGNAPTIEGSGGYGNIAIANTSNDDDVFVPDGETITFHGTLELTKEGIRINNDESNTNATQLNPATGGVAEVRRVVGGNGTNIGQNTLINTNNYNTGSSSSAADFNGAGNEYALTYGQNGGESTATDAGSLTDTGVEFTGNVTDVTVEKGAGVDLAGAETVGGVLTVNGQLASDGGNNLNLSTANNTHVVTGALTDNNSNHTNLRATAAGVTVNGYASGSSAPSGGDDAVLGSVEVTDGSGLTVDGIKKIKSTVNLNSGSNNTSLDIGLATDGDLSDNELLTSDAQSIAGVTTLNGGTATNSLTLNSDVTALDNVSAGEADISLGDSDLVVADADFTSSSPAISANGGFLVMEDDGSTSGVNDLNTGGNTVPNLRTTADDLSGGSVNETQLGGNVDVSGTLDIEVEIAGNTNTLTFSNSGDDKAILDASTAFSGGSAVFRAEGTEIEARTDASISNFSVSAPNGETVTLTSDSDGPYNVDVDNLQLDGGTLAHEGNNVDITTDGGGPFGSNGFIVTSNFDPSTDAVTSSEGGYIRFDNSGGVTTSLSSGGSEGASAITIDRLRVINGGGDLTDSDDRSLTIAEELSLDQKLGVPTSPADADDNIEVNGSALVKKTNDTDVLDEQLTFNGSTYDLTYASGIGSDINAEDELTTSSSVTIGTLRNNSGQTITFGNNNTEGVTAENLILESGTIDYNNNSDRLITIADGGTVERVDGDLETNDLEANGSFTLTYRPTSGNIDLTSGGGGDEEFTSAVSTLRFVDTDGNASANNLKLNENKTVDALEVDRSDGSSQFALNDNVLTVGGEAELTAGEVTGGTLDSDGTSGTLGADSDSDVLVSGALSSSLEAAGDVEVNGSLTSTDLTVEGDVDASSAGTFNPTNVTVQGDNDQSIDIPGDLSVTDFTVDQTTPSGSEVPSVSIGGGDVTVDGSGSNSGLDLSNGLLVVEGDSDLDLGTNGFSRSTADEDTSHVVGSVTRTVNSSNTVAEYPVGSSNANYRPFGFIFTEAPTQETDITVTHINENPGETGNLPITDNENVTVGENYPDYYWATESSNRLSISGEYEAFAQAEGLPFPDQSAGDFRIIQRASSGSDWSLVGDGTGYDNTPISESEGRVDVSTVGATADIRQSPTRFTVGVPTEAAAGFQLAGSVTYPVVNDGSLTGGRAISGATVEASSSDTTVTVTTDSDGNYSFSQLPAGDYDVEASVSEAVENVSTADALRAVRGFAGIDAFAGSFQEQVADVNGSGGVNATDALQIARFDLGLTDGFEVGPFVSETESVTLESDGVSGVEIFAAEAGDVRLDGGETGGSSQTLAASTLSPEQGLSAARTQSASSGASEAAVEAGETFEVPVRMGRGAEVGAYQMTVNYDSDIASFDGVKAAQEGVLTNASEDGTVQVSWFDQSGESALELRDGSDLVTLQFTASEDAAETDFSPEVKSGEITGPDAAPISAGVELQAVSIGALAPDEFALNGSYPNPVQGQATIEMDIPSKASVTVEVYNVLGQRVQTMEQSMSAGSGQTIQLDGSNLASGQYFYRVEADLEDGSAQKSGRITVVK
ncbi:T9SS type A sorting domain-containing protein [Salinibacter ruber]|uniref:T9SS type A sorting domain-containing protein n=1 Tax=Salinibacter ruber TaxID=146919 RepID=UPI002166F4AC|nr:T9SS type A sorting domain-containing protein [Salinibacter ruber]